MLLLFLLANYVNVAAFALMQNVALRKGEQLTLKCMLQSTSKFIDWHHIQVGTDNEFLIRSSNDTSRESSVKTNVREENYTSILTILPVQMSNAGLYGCKSLINSSTYIERAHVIVLDGNIRIVRQNSSHVSCEVEYNGNWTPELQLTAIVPGRPEAMHTANQTLVVNQSNGNRKVITSMELLSFDSNLTNYFCQLYFTNQSSKSHDNAVTNVPTYVDNVTCTSSDFTNSSLDVEQVTTTATKTHNPQTSSPPDINLVNLLAAFSFVFGIALIALIVAGVKRKRKRACMLSKTIPPPIVIPAPDILDGSEEGSSGFCRALPELPNDVYTYAEVMADNSNANLACGDSDTRQNRVVAADGTEYLIMNTLPRDGRPPAPPPAPSVPAPPPTLYASIDHLQTQIPHEF